MELDDLRIYKQALEIGEQIWEIVIKWRYFEKDTIGKQVIKAVDSIAANIGEGYGRYHYKDTKNFLYFSRGSLYETKTWLTKAYNRKIISESDYKSLIANIKDLSIKINNYIYTIGKKDNFKY